MIITSGMLDFHVIIGNVIYTEKHIIVFTQIPSNIHIKWHKMIMR